MYENKFVVSPRFTKPVILQEVASLEILGDHSLYYKIRSEVTIMCGGMEFSLYPLDHHVCSFMLSSCEYDNIALYLSYISYQMGMTWPRSGSLDSIATTGTHSGIFSSSQISGRLTSAWGSGTGRKVSWHSINRKIISFNDRELQHVWAGDPLD